MNIETKRLILRDYVRKDIDAFKVMNQDEKFQRFYSEEDCSSDRWNQLVTDFAAEPEQKLRKSYNLAITIKSNGHFIGAAGIRIEGNYQASVGCSLSRQFHMGGYAQEAMSAIVKFGFVGLGIHRIYAETISENKAAILLCTRLGMRIEAEFVEHKYFKG